MQGASEIVAPEGSATFLIQFAAPGARACILSHPMTEPHSDFHEMFRALGIEMTVLTGPIANFNAGDPARFRLQHRCGGSSRNSCESGWTAGAAVGTARSRITPSALVHAEEWIGLDEPERWSAALQGVPHGYWHCRTPCLAASVNTGSPVFLYVAHEQRGQSGLPPDGTGIEWQPRLHDSHRLLRIRRHDRRACHTRFRRAGRLRCATRKRFASIWPSIRFTRLSGRDADESAAGTLFLLELDRPPEKWLQGVDENRRRSILAWERAGSPWVRDREQLTAFVLEHHAGFMRSVGANGRQLLQRRGAAAFVQRPASRARGSGR